MHYECSCGFTATSATAFYRHLAQTKDTGGNHQLVQAKFTQRGTKGSDSSNGGGAGGVQGSSTPSPPPEPNTAAAPTTRVGSSTRPQSAAAAVGAAGLAASFSNRSLTEGAAAGLRNGRREAWGDAAGAATESKAGAADPSPSWMDEYLDAPPSTSPRVKGSPREAGRESRSASGGVRKSSTSATAAAAAAGASLTSLGRRAAAAGLSRSFHKGTAAAAAAVSGDGAVGWNQAADGVSREGAAARGTAAAAGAVQASSSAHEVRQEGGQAAKAAGALAYQPGPVADVMEIDCTAPGGQARAHSHSAATSQGPPRPPGTSGTSGTGPATAAAAAAAATPHLSVPPSVLRMSTAFMSLASRTLNPLKLFGLSGGITGPQEGGSRDGMQVSSSRSPYEVCVPALEGVLMWQQPWHSARVFGLGLYLLICFHQLGRGSAYLQPSTALFAAAFLYLLNNTARSLYNSTAAARQQHQQQPAETQQQAGAAAAGRRAQGVRQSVSALIVGAGKESRAASAPDTKESEREVYEAASRLLTAAALRVVPLAAGIITLGYRALSGRRLVTSTLAAAVLWAGMVVGELHILNQMAFTLLCYVAAFTLPALYVRCRHGLDMVVEDVLRFVVRVVVHSDRFALLGALGAALLLMLWGPLGIVLRTSLALAAGFAVLLWQSPLLSGSSAARQPQPHPPRIQEAQ